MKSKEELNQLKEEYENLTKKFSELSQEEMKEVIGGFEFECRCNMRNDPFIPVCPFSKAYIQLHSDEDEYRCYSCKKNYLIYKN